MVYGRGSLLSPYLFFDRLFFEPGMSIPAMEFQGQPCWVLGLWVVMPLWVWFQTLEALADHRVESTTTVAA